MEQYKRHRSKYQGEKDKKENFAKLGRKITDVAAHKLKGVSTDDPEYWGLREVLTDEMVDLANLMKLRQWYTLDEVRKLAPDVEPTRVYELLEEMSYIGILEFDYGDNYDHYGEIKDRPRIKRYRIPFFVPGSAELFNSSVDRIEKNPAVANFFERMTFAPLQGVTQMIPPGGAGVGMHVIPVEQAIGFENESVDLEEISYWLKKYDGHISAGICSCRASMRMLGEPCADDHRNWCIQLGDMADYTVETGRAKYITKDEALEILKMAEENGFVHQITNIDGENKIFDICNCDVKICHALRTSLLFNTPNMSRSAYTSKVKPENCVACGACVEICPTGAVKLGQKLCRKDGTPQEYPTAVLPDTVMWGKYAWDENYRDTPRMTSTYETGTAPCKAACPAHISIQGYLQKAKEGKYDEALAVIKRSNPFPAVCGRVCNKPCEDACTRGTVDDAVSIDAVKKFVSDWEIDQDNRYVPPKIVPSTLGKFEEKIAIIGGGPAGLTCAYYLAQLGYTPTVFEKNDKPGGMMTYGIPAYKLEKDVIDAEIDVIRQLGVEIKTNCQVGKDITLDKLRAQGYKAFYIAIGCQGGRRPGVLNDDAPGTEIAVDYLKESLDNNYETYEGKVVVIGGGNVAIDCAMTASRRGASEVSMISLENREEMPAGEGEIDEAKTDGVNIINSWGPKEVLLDDKGHVKGIVLKRCTQVMDPETKAFSPKFDESEILTIDCDLIVFAIGQTILWDGLLDGSKVKFHHGNYPMADDFTFQTAQEDVFVGGDNFTGPKFVIDAVAQGHYAAESLHRYAQEANMTIGRDRHNYKPFDTEDITIPDTYDRAGRQDEVEDPDVISRFKESKITLTEAQVREEAGRCLSCGAARVDPNKCIGCGLCTLKCDFDAIHLYRDRPEMTRMIRTEDKFKLILPYQLKRGFKILANAGTKEAREMRAKRKKFKREMEEFNKQNPNTGNKVVFGESEDA